MDDKDIFGMEDSENKESKEKVFDEELPKPDDEVFFGVSNAETDEKLNKVQNRKLNKKGNVKKTLSKVTSYILSAIILILTFVLGYISAYFVQNTDAAFASWSVKMINKYAYFAEEEVSSYDLIKLGIDGVLNDPYAKLFSPEETEKMLEENKGESTSIGMTVGQYNVLEGLYVLNVIGGSPADKAGVKVDYRVVTVDGQDYWTGNLDALTSYIKSVASNTEIEFVFALPIYQNDTLEYSRDNTVTVRLKRETYIEKIVYYYDNSSEEFKDILDSDTAYIQLKSFVGDTAEQFDAAMQLFKNNGKHTLILDLRDNTGGSDYNLKAVGAHLLKDESDGDYPLILTQKFKDGSETSLHSDKSRYEEYGFNKIVVLVNGYTASASEALLLAMIDYQTADVIIGTTTYGKGTGLQTRIMPMTKYAIRFTVSYFYSPYGNTNEKIGITPTAGYYLDYDATNVMPYKFNKDNQFMRAVNYLK